MTTFATNTDSAPLWAAAPVLRELGSHDLADLLEVIADRHDDYIGDGRAPATAAADTLGFEEALRVAADQTHTNYHAPRCRAQIAAMRLPAGWCTGDKGCFLRSPHNTTRAPVRRVVDSC